jgi:hypothetical protein
MFDLWIRRVLLFFDEVSIKLAANALAASFFTSVLMSESSKDAAPFDISNT